MPETEIRSESIRYSCDIPGQALAYKLGDTVLYEARETMRATLGDRFDIRDFHDAVLKPGALPLPLVQQHVEAETRRIAAGRRGMPSPGILCCPIPRLRPPPLPEQIGSASWRESVCQYV